MYNISDKLMENDTRFPTDVNRELTLDDYDQQTSQIILRIIEISGANEICLLVCLT
jgi:hypothetical protein